MTLLEKVAEALGAEGFRPEMEEFGISFKYQMTTFIFMKDKSDSSFFNLVIPYIYDIDEKNELDVLRACNTVNNAMKMVKLVDNDQHVWVCFECELSEDVDMDEVVRVLRFAVPTMAESRVRFYDALKAE